MDLIELRVVDGTYLWHLAAGENSELVHLIRRLRHVIATTRTRGRTHNSRESRAADSDAWGRFHAYATQPLPGRRRPHMGHMHGAQNRLDGEHSVEHRTGFRRGCRKGAARPLPIQVSGYSTQLLPR